MSRHNNRKPVESLVTDLPDVTMSFDLEAFDTAISTSGVKLVHYSALRCPVGITDVDDNRRAHPDHAGCSKGFLYHKVGTIQALLTGNGNTQSLRDIGFVDGASFVSTFTRTYSDCDKPFMAAPFDRFYLDEESITVPTWQLSRASASGTERLAFPVVMVERLVDSRGDEYKQGEDFCIKDGLINWKEDGRRPMDDLETGRGAVISVRYSYRPFFYVERLMHEIRVAQVESILTNDRKLVRANQQLLLNREFLYLDSENDPQSIAQRNPRQQPGPDDGGFGSSR